jgi:hypothetical protein
VERFLLEGMAPVTCGGGEGRMKIYFLLMIVSVFVAVSYIPIRTEQKQKAAAPADSVPVNA